MPATLDRQPLGQLLVSRGLLQSAQLDSALAEQHRCNHEKLLGEILVEQKLCSDEQVTEALSLAYGLPFARLSPRLVDPKAIALLPYEFLIRNVVLPMFRVERTLTVAVSEPANLFLIEEIQRRSGMSVQIVAATARDIRTTLEAYLPNEQEFVVDGGIAAVTPESFRFLDVPQAPSRPARPLDPPIARLIEYCIYTAIKQTAREIHIEPGDAELRIRFRIDGHLVTRLRPPARMHAPLTARLKTLANLDASRTDIPQEGRLRVLIDNHPHTLRLFTLPARQGEKLVLHITYEEHSPLKLEKLGFSYDMLKQWRKLLAHPGGLMLICGPAGSGKRSVLYSSLLERNTEEANLCSLESPIEQTLTGVNQFSVNSQAGFDFPMALRQVLAQSPDVIALSDLPDGATAVLATQAALGGKLVIASLQCSDTPSAIAHLLHLGLDPHVLGSTLLGVLARRLVRRLCPSCKSAYEPSSSQKRQLSTRPVGFGTLYRARGCERCHQLGFAGRIGIHELLIPDDAFRDQLSAGPTLADLRTHCARHAPRTLRADGLEKAQAGVTTPEEVFRVTT